MLFEMRTERNSCARNITGIIIIISKLRVRYDLRKFGFSNRVINKWNSLPNLVVSANTTNTFKVRLDKFWHNQDIVYDFRAQLQGTGSRSEVLCEEF